MNSLSSSSIPGPHSKQFCLPIFHISNFLQIITDTSHLGKQIAYHFKWTQKQTARAGHARGNTVTTPVPSSCLDQCHIRRHPPGNSMCSEVEANRTLSFQSYPISVGPSGTAPRVEVRGWYQAGGRALGKERGGEKLENGFLLPLKNLNFREKTCITSKGLFQQKWNKASTSGSILYSAAERSNRDVAGRCHAYTGVS